MYKKTIVLLVAAFAVLASILIIGIVMNINETAANAVHQMQTDFAYYETSVSRTFTMEAIKRDYGSR